MAVTAARTVMAPNASLGITLNLRPCRPASGSMADLEATVRVDGYANRWFLARVFKGTYPSDIAGSFHSGIGEDHIRTGDLETICAPLDFLGVNYYACNRVAAAGGPWHPGGRAGPAAPQAVERPDPDIPVTGRGWPIQPDGLTELLERIDHDYGHIPIYITENGAAFADYVVPEGRVKDPERVKFLESHLLAALDAVTSGVDLRGYFCWTLLDNFEWAAGYSQRFGLVWVDFADQKRIPKARASWHARVAARNGVVRGNDDG